jgi:hypothetical protein
MCLLDGKNLLVTSRNNSFRILFPFSLRLKTTPRGIRLLSTLTILSPTIYVAILPENPNEKRDGLVSDGPPTLGENGFADPAKPNICGVTAR